MGGASQVPQRPEETGPPAAVKAAVTAAPPGAPP